MSTGTANGNGAGNGSSNGSDDGSGNKTGNKSALPKPSSAFPVSHGSSPSQKPQSSAQGTSFGFPTAGVTPVGPVSTPLIRVPTGSAWTSSTLSARPTGSASRVPLAPSGTTGTEPLFTGSAAKTVGNGFAMVMAVLAVAVLL